ncbi:MAG: Pr6Pr family membrane protein, partial [Myxococcales bacterium]|nr:Pr6Pr family membrane protein [Myxococcales bacterium]
MPFWLTYPLAYCAYALLRAEVDGIYPYPFLDVAAEGMLSVSFNVARCCWPSRSQGWPSSRSGSLCIRSAGDRAVLGQRDRGRAALQDHRARFAADVIQHVLP